jgi:DNA modification methylase
LTSYDIEPDDGLLDELSATAFTEGTEREWPATAIAEPNGEYAASTLSDPVFAGNKTHRIHRWVNWIAGFSWRFAGDAIDRYVGACGSGRRDAVVLDPFAGVGTTLVEAQRRGIRCIGFEINPFAHLAAKSKLEAATVNPECLRDRIDHLARSLRPIEAAIDVCGVGAAPTPVRKPPAGFRSRIPFFSEKVLRKVLLSLDYIDSLEPGPIADLFRLAFATTMVGFSNYTYEPSLSSRPGAGKPLQENAPVVEAIILKLRQMADDIDAYASELDRLDEIPQFDVHLENFFTGAVRLADESVDLVVTSPPYLNNYHYIRNTRPHLFWLGYVASPRDLRQYERANFGKFWQTVREELPIRLSFDLPELSRKIEELRQLNPHKGIYGGAGWANYAASYFNDAHRLLTELGRILRPGGTAVIVVGNNVLQGIEFRVDEEMARIADSVGLRGRTEVVRNQRVGSSILGTGLRQKASDCAGLYEAAVIVEKPSSAGPKRHDLAAASVDPASSRPPGTRRALAGRAVGSV